MLSDTPSNTSNNSVDDGGSFSDDGEERATAVGGQPLGSRISRVFGLSCRLRHGDPRGDVSSGHERNNTVLDVVRVPRFFDGVLTLALSKTEETMAWPVQVAPAQR